MTQDMDQLFYLNSDTRYLRSIWTGYSATFGNGLYPGFAGVLRKLIDDSTTLSPGPYCIVRLDRSVNADAPPCIAWVGTLNDDMTVTDGLTPSDSPRVTHWPPKSPAAVT